MEVASTCSTEAAQPEVGVGCGLTPALGWVLQRHRQALGVNTNIPTAQCGCSLLGAPRPLPSHHLCAWVRVNIANNTGNVTLARYNAASLPADRPAHLLPHGSAGVLCRCHSCNLSSKATMPPSEASSTGDTAAETAETAVQGHHMMGRTIHRLGCEQMPTDYHHNAFSPVHASTPCVYLVTQWPHNVTRVVASFLDVQVVVAAQLQRKCLQTPWWSVVAPCCGGSTADIHSRGHIYTSTHRCRAYPSTTPYAACTPSGNGCLELSDNKLCIQAVMLLFSARANAPQHTASTVASCLSLEPVAAMLLLVGLVGPQLSTNDEAPECWDHPGSLQSGKSPRLMPCEAY